MEETQLFVCKQLFVSENGDHLIIQPSCCSTNYSLRKFVSTWIDVPIAGNGCKRSLRDTVSKACDASRQSTEAKSCCRRAGTTAPARTVVCSATSRWSRKRSPRAATAC